MEEMQEYLETASNISSRQWLTALVVFAALLLISQFIIRLIKKKLERSAKINKTLYPVLVSAANFLLILICVMIAVNTLGISVSAFLLVFAIIGTAITLI